MNFTIHICILSTYPDMVLVQVIRFLRISVSRQVQSQHPVSCLGKESHLVSPDKPELREPVDKHHQWLLIFSSFHVVNLETINFDKLVDSKTGILYRGNIFLV